MPTSVKLEPGQLSPPPSSASASQPRTRRKRVAIEIPADLELENMDPKDVKKLKNRIAAARLRERSQQQIRELQAAVEFYKARTEYLEAMVSSCAHCSCLAQAQQLAPLDHANVPFVARSQRVASPHLHHEHSFEAANGSGSQCNSPASSTEDEYMGDCDLTLDDIDSDLLAKMLLMTE